MLSTPKTKPIEFLFSFPTKYYNEQVTILAFVFPVTTLSSIISITYSKIYESGL
jgi:hypothetical protein